MSVTINGNGTVTGLSALPTSAMATGSIVQAKHLQFTTDLFFTASSTTDVSGFSLSITPTSTSNDIIIILHCTMGLNCDGRMGLKRNGTVIETQIIGTGRNNLLHDVGTYCASYKDSPSSTSAVTYQVIVRASGCSNQVSINESGSGSTDNGKSGMTLLEIKG